jgi:ADP-ribose pyrophosphatase YjhB (NUDIX family)
MVSGSIPSCDHTSVGVLAWRSGRLLLIERRKPPVGIAPPAGHVDQHGSFEAAAAAELFEETGLHSGRFDLLKSAAYRNPCRRPGGDWHHWRIYEATDLWGELHPSPSETKGARWYDLNEIVILHDRTRLFQRGSISLSDWEKSPGIEPIWADIFDELRMLPNSKGAPSTEADMAWARIYSWDWFKFHAQQRLTVFNFYLVFSAFLFAGFATLAVNSKYELCVLVAIAIVLVNFLFWRLDLRNTQLVKISELFLKDQEKVLASSIGTNTIAIADAAENKWHRWPYSFSEIHRLLLLLAGLLGIGLAIWSGIQWAGKIPDKEPGQIIPIQRSEFQNMKS